MDVYHASRVIESYRLSRKSIAPLLLCGLCFFIEAKSVSARGRVDVTVGVGTRAEIFPGEIANFGNRNSKKLYASEVNLVLPPVDQRQLCNYPEESIALASLSTHSSSISYSDTSETEILINTSNTTTEGNASVANSREGTDIALFVSWGGCILADKAVVAAALQQNFTQYGTVTHLIIYNTNDKAMDSLYALSASDEYDELTKGISIICVSTRSGRDIMEIMMNEEQTGERYANPLFLAPGNDVWYMPVSFEATVYEYGQFANGHNSTGGFHEFDHFGDSFVDDMSYPPTRQSTNTDIEVDDFYYFRLIIFSLLVVSPCFRAAYLWYAGGARIRFQYNEDGRIVGLHYTPPMPYWFAPRPDESYAHQASRMTHEQVMALPEIIYEENLSSEQLASTEGVVGQPSETLTAHHAVVQGTDGGLSELDNGNTKQYSDDTTVLDLVDEEQALPQPERNPSEMHSTCSICIDDFEHGEKLRMLPRCRHIFHTDCILPWLTERQGCCPLCKTEVIEPEHGQGSVGYDEGHDHVQEAGASMTQTESVDTAANEPGHTDTALASTTLPTHSSPPRIVGDDDEMAVTSESNITRDERNRPERGGSQPSPDS